ncbi:aspartate carbamoyltransferase [Austwickia chelonae]|uniref:Aspartate carbamoyltransferase n=1 Tax=Austwickia chelonae NBRC 105200 TaxID=1184607 RepID=K6VLS8_9MICO|nr:aspartate carbamoyltransferase catalytic subunit [Austwickia chelonae]GAB77689.1 aspartate carbamoyltransferase [Austwickia chelonae NBRC 105200]SEW15824.1 aspartate carbamoyltransferase [Austwickia chelonae]
MKLPHFLSTDGLTRDQITQLLDTAEEMEKVRRRREMKKIPALRGVTVVNAFFEDSTRTKNSFDLAAKSLSADTMSFSGKGSSTSKGESLRDTVLTIAAMGVDGFVIRHSASGAPKLAMDWTGLPVVNAGDGTHEHPTQALLDAYAMRQRLGDLEGRHVAIVGDLLHSRVVRSNIFCLRTLGAHVTLVAPPTLMPPGIEERAAAEGFSTTYDLDSMIGDVDALMMLRVQRERMSGGFFPTEAEYSALFGLTRPRLERLGKEAVICHPGPMNRGLEISPEAADAANSLILDQVAAGVYTRMAVLFHVFSGEGSAA